MKSLLKKVPLFSNLTDNDFDVLTSGIKKINLEKGDTLFHEGEKGDRAYIIEKGQIEIFKKSEGRDVLIAITKKGDIIGEIALLEDSPRIASARAGEDSSLFEISRQDFELLLKKNYSATRSILKTVVKRWQETEGLLRQSEKMAQIGTLTAGITHELNNPSAAIKRSAESLLTTTDELLKAERFLHGKKFSSQQIKILTDLEKTVREKAKKPDDLDTVSRANLEEKFEEWLEAQKVRDPWRYASLLVLVNFSKKDLNTLENTFDKNLLPSVIPWLCTSYNFYSLLEEISQGATRVYEIVNALKSYSFLGEGPVQNVDVHVGIDNTLILLRSRLKDNIIVKRKYSKDIPKIQGYGSELNQVWTNIIDNAADAMKGGGVIEIETKLINKQIVVRIKDNGPGIPPEILSKIFDPFFTTKEPGRGTGLGLDISYNIIVNKHGGDISVKSKPGETVFEIKLPVKT